MLLLADSFQTDFINCIARSFHSASASSTLTIHIGEGMEVERVLGTCMTSSVKRFIPKLPSS